jgi:hypothetical protein
MHRGVGIGCDRIERGGLVEVKALYAIQRVNLVPDKEVPVAPFEASLEVRLVKNRTEHLGVGSQGYILGVVTTQVEYLGLGVSYLAKDLYIAQIPAIAPLCLPVVGDIVANLVIPNSFELEVYDRYIKVCVCTTIQMQIRLAIAGGEN